MFGREKDLIRLNEDRHNPSLPKISRWRADRAYKRIGQQMKDRAHMKLRLRLIKATQAGDMKEVDKIEKMIRDYTKEDKETGL